MIVAGLVAVHLVYLWLHFLPLPVAPHEGGVYLVIKVADVTYHSATLECFQHTRIADIEVAGSGHEDVTNRSRFFHSDNSETFHCRL